MPKTRNSQSFIQHKHHFLAVFYLDICWGKLSPRCV